jgi:uncharacterized membrane protein YfbV (UPF0208 family)
MQPLQADPVGGGPLALLGTVLVLTALSAVTLHLAALWVLGDEPHQSAVKAAPVPVVIAMLFSRYRPAIVLPLVFVGVVATVRYVYGLTTRGAVLVAVFYLSFTIIFVFSFGTLLL